MADKALLVGINNYAHVSDLRGCVNDVLSMHNTLSEQYGFEDSQFRELLDEEATKRQIEDGFRWLLDGAQLGDRLVFHFSGHGSFIESTDSDESVDELLCLQNMNWDDPDSYLVDDQLGVLLEGVPPGVRLTVVLDSCFSGTGTRAIQPQRRAKGGLVIDADTELQANRRELRGLERRANRAGDALTAYRNEPERLVLARFVEPRPRYQELRTTHKVMRLGRSLTRTTLNHQLLSAASDSQTAADAYIDGDFHGAFSYYLTRSASQLGHRATTKTVFDCLCQSLRNEGFTQTPQLEGPWPNERLFGGESGGPSDPGGDGPEPISSPKPLDPSGPISPCSVVPATETFSQLLSLGHRFLDVADRVLPAASTEARPAAAERAANEAVVYVHGISQHRPGYSEPWWTTMQPHLTRSMLRREVVWSDLVNPRSAVLQRALPHADRAHTALHDEIEAELAERLAQLQDAAGVARNAGTTPSRSLAKARGDGLKIDDFVLYMLNDSVREAILQRFEAVVRPLLDSGCTLHIISHSWGTVVAYEGLRRLESVPVSGNVANLFLVGSALSIRAVRKNLFARVSDGRRPARVAHAVNLDAHGDIVGGKLRPHYEVDAEHLDLPPVGCRVIPVVGAVPNISCAHSSYFHRDNLHVNRDIFAAAINRHGLS